MFVKILNITTGTKTGFVKIGAFTFECLVVEPNDCVLSLTSIHKNFGYSGNSSLWLYTILENLHQRTALPIEILEAYHSPLLAQMTNSNNQVRQIETVAVSSLINTCEILLLKDLGDSTLENEIALLETAKKILTGTKTLNITELIEEATGYSLSKEHALSMLDSYFSMNTDRSEFKWIKTFPKSIWNVLFEIHGLNWVSIRENPTSVARILYDIIFSRLSDSLLDEIRHLPPKRTYKRKGNQLQQNEHLEIKEYFIRITTLLNITNNNWPVFLQLLNRTHPINPNYKTKLPLFIGREAEEKPILSNFNKILLKTS